ncbi:MAG: ATP-dependent DNA helicase [Candidatus Nomurabacteria bacterium GW2011_GWB1_40_7]|uniref:Probable DNA 3'-5' helicase RecG n=1 Tax=Candidatus Nomurabacteria bacterium GW2011_GWB1_40_7 TaxID=1618744 RepID=A0A0G0T137_9BACT|nr:MAG: ATP-dependent DNA helicase [Candidatus Nomurabacteria bacterium GW2011_GWB1_40_7]
MHNRLELKFRLDASQKKALHRLKIFSVADLLFYFPVRYSHISEIKPISQLVAGEYATVYGRFWSPDIKRGFRSKILRAEGEVMDETGKIKVVWFNQAYLAKMIHSGQFVELTGKVMESKRGKYMANPEFKKIDSMPIDIHESLFNFDKKKQSEVFGFPVYIETKGITSKWFYHTILKIIKDKTLNNIEDYIPKEILQKYHLPSLKSALIWIHSPKNAKDAETARKRFAFEEVFCIQLERQHDKFEYRKNKSFQVKLDKNSVEDFLNRFPFALTDSQKKSTETILGDMAKNFPMSRLLEGDVGSGKTAVAATATYATVNQRPNGQSFGNLQVAYMAPTEILATQHFESFIQYFKHLSINVGLITGSGCRKFPSKVNPSGWTTISRAQLLKWVANGEIPILIGTHALIQKTVKFKNLALVVIDEQHRFGTAQRRKLVRKDGIAPHLLSMTATPIPRTLALTIYGDLDLSLLSEMPAGRKQIITEIITPNKREETYEKIRKELKAGRQLYVICPRIFEPDPEKELALNVKSAVTEAKILKTKVFPEYEIGVLHSKMSKEKKENVMADFAEGKINILCATSVVEVGVNVPNATVIIIEGAERFGLAQLHQLRGRVIRSTHQAYCYIFAEAKSEKTISRLKALKTAKNGFELAELDLTLRGAGELGGTKQWGITDLGMEAIKNIKMVEAARAEAVRLIEEDPELSKYPLLKEKVRQKVQEFHFE